MSRSLSLSFSLSLSVPLLFFTRLFTPARANNLINGQLPAATLITPVKLAILVIRRGFLFLFFSSLFLFPFSTGFPSVDVSSAFTRARAR